MKMVRFTFTKLIYQLFRSWMARGHFGLILFFEKPLSPVLDIPVLNWSFYQRRRNTTHVARPVLSKQINLHSTILYCGNQFTNHENKQNWKERLTTCDTATSHCFSCPQIQP